MLHETGIISEKAGILQDLDPENAALQMQFVASQFRFDPQGFEKEMPLRKRPFYSHPFLTCTYCNTLVFLDVSSIRYVEAQIEQKLYDEDIGTVSMKPRLVPPNDVLKPCEKCKRVDGFVAGARDMTQEVRKQEQKVEDHHVLEIASAGKILRAYRRHLQRMYTRSVFVARTVRMYLKGKAATIIASIMRGRLARRRYITEKHLVNIRESHDLLIRHALKIIPGQPKVFWYRRSVELQMVFADYVDFVERTGFQPPRIIVERNIAELSRRITERKNSLIIMVQKRWRGFVARRIVRYFRTEIHRIFSHTVANAMRIQAVYRAHAVRRKIPQWRTILYQRKIMQDYRHQCKIENIKSRRALAAEKAQIAYQQERKDVQMGRFVEKIAYASELPNSSVTAMKSMTAYQLNKTGAMQELDESPYGDDRYLYRDAMVISEDQKLVQDIGQQIQGDLDRLAFIKSRIAESGPSGFGLRSGISTNPHVQSTMAKVLSMKKESSRSKAMRMYFQNEFETINQRAFERVNKHQRAIAIAPTPVPNMAELDPLYALQQQQRQQKQNSSDSTPLGGNLPSKKKVSAISERLRDEFRLYNLSRLGDDALINRPGSQKMKKPSISLLENVKVPQKKAEGSRSVTSTPLSSSHKSARSDGQPSTRFFTASDNEEPDAHRVASARTLSSSQIEHQQSSAAYNMVGDASSDNSDVASKDATPMVPGHSDNLKSPPSKLRVRRFRTGDDADAKRKEVVIRSKQRADRAAMIAKRPKYKGFEFPQDVNFNSVGWLYEEDDDVIFG